MDISRRDWLMTSLTMATWQEVLAAQQHAHQSMKSSSAPSLDFLDPQTASEIDALVSRIIPSDETPGAHEAGVVYFIDRALSTFDRSKQEVYRGGLIQTQAERKALFPGSTSIAALNEEQQIELLRSIEQTEFFQLLRMHTLCGFLGDPSYGGNRNNAGWNVIGFENSMRFEPPFGYYDDPKHRLE